MSETAPTRQLQRIVDFVNTLDVGDGADVVATPEGLTTWLTTHGLLDGGQQASAQHVRRALALREALRAALRGHHDRTAPTEVEQTNSVLAALPLIVQLDAGGGPHLVPAGDGVDAALGRIVAAIPQAMADGTWERTKACSSDTCQWAFYDRSRNRSRRWCSMEVCGNREKTRTFRARHASG